MADEQNPTTESNEPVVNTDAGGHVVGVDLQLEMQRSYLDYAMSVIVGLSLIHI